MTQQKNLRIVTLLLAGLVLSACAGKAVILEPIPPISDVPAREVPADETLSPVVVIEGVATDKDELEENVTYKSRLSIPYDSKVVISVPVEEQKRESKRRQNEFGVLSGAGEGGDSDGRNSLNFKTTGYFNKAEQQIEKRLIKQNFTVLDRSKFEAKLRIMRAEKTNALSYAARDVAKKNLKEKFEADELTLEQYMDALQKLKIENEFEKGGRRKPGQAQELVDISELIRAAQTGPVRADYVFQVNNFKIDFLTDKQINLLKQPEIKTLTDKHEGLMAALESSDRYMITQPGFYGLLNAKLIEIETGSIVWVGEHRVQSENVLKNGFRITIPITKQVINGDEINQAIADYNDSLHRLKQQVEAQEKAIHEKRIKAKEKEQRIAAYEKTRQQLVAKLNAGPPAASKAKWQYKYRIGQVSVDPILPTARELSNIQEQWRHADTQEKRSHVARVVRRYNEFLEEHYADLAKLVTKELISTIPTEK